MSYLFRTLIVTSAQSDLARSLAASLAGDAGENMWLSGLSGTGSEPATHYVSTGMIEERFVGAVSDAAILYGACQAAGLDVTQAQCTALVSSSDVSEDDPFVAFDRLGLKLIQGDAA